MLTVQHRIGVMQRVADRLFPVPVHVIDRNDRAADFVLVGAGNVAA